MSKGLAQGKKLNSWNIGCGIVIIVAVMLLCRLPTTTQSAKESVRQSNETGGLTNRIAQTVTTTMATTTPSLVLVPTDAPASPTATGVLPCQTVQPISGALQTDLLGIQFKFVNIDKSLEITDWTTYTNKHGYFEIAGELKNSTIDQRFSSVDFTIRFYDTKGSLINIEHGSAGGRWVDPNNSLPFKIQTYLNPQDFSTYTVEVSAGDLRNVPLSKSVEPVHQQEIVAEIKDNLGIAYVIHDNDARLDLSKIESTENGDGAVELSGELTLVNDARIEEAGVTIKFYDEKGETIGGFGVLARKMPTTNRLIFYLNTKLSKAQIGWSELQWDGP